MATNMSKLGDILSKVINKDVRNAGVAAVPPMTRAEGEEARAGDWLVILEPILDAEYPNWRVIHNYPS